VELRTASPDGRDAALGCGMDQMIDREYMPLERSGTTTANFWMTKPIDYTAGEVGREAATRVATMGIMGSNRQRAHVINVVAGATTMRLIAAGEYDDGSFGKPNEAGLADAQAIIAACGSGSVGSHP